MPINNIKASKGMLPQKIRINRMVNRRKKGQSVRSHLVILIFLSGLLPLLAAPSRGVYLRTVGPPPLRFINNTDLPTSSNFFVNSAINLSIDETILNDLSLSVSTNTQLHEESTNEINFHKSQLLTSNLTDTNSTEELVKPQTTMNQTNTTPSILTDTSPKLISTYIVAEKLQSYLNFIQPYPQGTFSEPNVNFMPPLGPIRTNNTKGDL